MKIYKKYFFMLAGVVIFTIAICLLAFPYKTENSVKFQKSEEPSLKNPTVNETFFNEDVPAKREGVNMPLTLEERKLSPAEEKTIIESLWSQINVDKSKTFFEYKWGFCMVPGVKEVFKDIDNALCLFTDQGKFFVKINNYSDLSRFIWEKESMLAINEAVPDFTPHPFCLGSLPNGGKFLVVNFVEETRWQDRLIIENQKLFAKSLAQLHQKKSPNGKFGFHAGKNNQWKVSWEKFFQENRWKPLQKRVLKKYPDDEEMKKWVKIIGEKVIPNLLGNLLAEPVLLHGNLGSGCWGINSQTNKPWIFDAHSYYGHNEMDLLILGYPFYPNEISEPEFLTEYQKYNPLQPGFEERKLLYQLYNYLHREIACDGYELSQKQRNNCLIMMKKLG